HPDCRLHALTSMAFLPRTGNEQTRGESTGGALPRSGDALRLPAAPERESERLELGVIRLPGGVHHAADRDLAADAGEPPVGLRLLAVVVAGDRLRVAPAVEEAEALDLVAPVQDLDVPIQAAPPARQRSFHQVV